jgi:hypothetical protein
MLSLAILLTLSAAPEPAWTELLVEADAKKSPWKTVDKGWIYAADASLDTEKPARLKATGKGNVWVNGDTGRLKDLVTKEQYTDIEVSVEFMLGKNSNSGIKFHAVYEIQLRDTAAKTGELEGDDCGGIYPRAEAKPKYHHIDKGIGPKVNAAKPAGEWQTLEVQFRSPRVEDGKKVKNALIVVAKLNGKIIHENLELKHPTGHNYVRPEVAKGPFMLQADHGPTAFRNVKLRELPAAK